MKSSVGFYNYPDPPWEPKRLLAKGELRPRLSRFSLFFVGVMCGAALESILILLAR